MFKEFVQILTEHGVFFAVGFVVVIGLVHYALRMKKVWDTRDQENIEAKIDIQKDELRNHPFFIHADFKINAEIPVLKINGDANHPVRQDMFRDVVRYYIISMREVCNELVEKDMEKSTPSQWAINVNEKIGMISDRFTERARSEGIPEIVTKKFVVWQKNTIDTLRNYVSVLAISKVYTSTNARTNTFLYLMNLALSTTVADAEKSISLLNGEITGLSYKNKIID